jgi:EmrB/QacA subfamily drug resistance transporter
MTQALARQTLSRRGVIVLPAVCLSCLMFGLEISSIPAILPTLEQVLHADFKQLQWIMNAYTIAVTTVLMATGTLADRYGRKRMFAIFIAAFGLTSMVCGLAENVVTLIVARFLQGASGGAMLICQVAVLSHEFKGGNERASAFGWWGVMFGIGLGFGPLIGGAIVAVLSWKWVFLVHVLLASVALALTLGGVHESKDPKAGRLDIAGIVTLSLSVFCLAFYITQGPDLGFASPTALAIFGVSIASFIAFLIAENVSPRPMFDFSVFRVRDFSGAIIGSAAMNISYWPFMVYLPIWFHAGLGYDSVTAGLALLAYTLPTLVMPPLAERLSLRYQPGIIIPAGLFTIGAGLMLMKLGSAAVGANWLTMLPDRRDRPRVHQHTRHQHDDGLGLERPRRHGLRHRHECPDGFARDQYRDDGFHPGERRVRISQGSGLEHQRRRAAAACRADRCRKRRTRSRARHHHP